MWDLWSFCVLVPGKRPGSPVGVSTLVGHMENFSASLTHTHFHVILLRGNQSKSLWNLIDSGVDENFWMPCWLLS